MHAPAYPCLPVGRGRQPPFTIFLFNNVDTFGERFIMFLFSRVVFEIR